MVANSKLKTIAVPSQVPGASDFARVHASFVLRVYIYTYLAFVPLYFFSGAVEVTFGRMGCEPNPPVTLLRVQRRKLTTKSSYRSHGHCVIGGVYNG